MASFIKDLASVALSKGGVITFSLVRTIVIARWLGPELNGTIAALAVYPSIFMTIGSLGIRQSTAYYVGQKIYDEKKIQSSIIQLWWLSTIFCLISSYLLIKYFSKSSENNFLVLLAIAPIPFNLLTTYISGLFLGKNEIVKFNKVNWLPKFITMLATILFVIALKMSIDGAMMSAIIGPLVMSVVLLKTADFKGVKLFDFDWKILKSMLSLGSVYAIALLVINLNYKIDVVILDKMSSDFETGIYSKGQSLVEYLWHIPMLLSTIIFARSATAKDGKKFSLKVAQLLRVSCLIIGLASIILVLNASTIINLLYGKSFAPSAEVLVILIPGVLLLTIFKVLNMDLAGKGKPWISLKAMVPALIINVILNILLIPTYGAKGAAFASTVSYTFAAILFLFIYSKLCKIPIKEIIRYKKEDFTFIESIKNKVFKST
ncbi:flippase [Echinicola sp. CAU 1574]|uniref:Flippase n=1 Tax=Echinicola arenosa TaxID=2774144 RepID=A0ABR9ARA6_9BACT|nr:flippase [Echinicola arenosa]MBD8490475.1 flippase [Echinicola arenosa]